MKNELIKGNKNQLPDGGLEEKELPQKYTWITALVKAILGSFSKKGKRKRKVKFKRTEITKDKFIQQEFTYKEEQTTKD